VHSIKALLVATLGSQ